MPINTDKAIIRDDIGHLRLRQCTPKLHVDKATSQHIKDFNRKTTGDILNRLQFNNLLRSIVLNK